MRLTVNMRLLTQFSSMSVEEQKHIHSFADWLICLGNGELNIETDILLPKGIIPYILITGPFADLK